MYLLMLLYIITACNRSKQPALFIISDNGKYGYINQKGEVVIPAAYAGAGDFSEGLAAVRKDGLYGYINTSGEYVIPPKYEYALAFNEGMAKVYDHGTITYINTKGETLFQHNYNEQEPFEDGLLLIKTASKKMGMLNRRGKLVVDTAYSEISPFYYGFAIVESLRDEYGSSTVGMIDTTGKMVIPYGKYNYIIAPSGGYFKAGYIEDSIPMMAYLDPQLQVKLHIKDKIRELLGDINEGLIVFTAQRKGRIGPFGDMVSDTYERYMDMTGRIVINDTTFDYAKPFANNRAFVRVGRVYFMINKKGQKVSAQSFERIENDMFSDGLAAVAISNSNGPFSDTRWGVIDTNANFVAKPVFYGIRDLNLTPGYFFFEGREIVPLAEYQDAPMGLATTSGRIIIPAVMQSYNPAGFVNGLLACKIKNRPAYVDTSGKLIWQAPVQTSLPDLNVDMAQMAWYQVDALPSPDNPFSQRIRGDENYPKKISVADPFPKDSLSLTVTSIRDTLNARYNGYRVFLANHTGKQIDIAVIDNHLYMTMQALTEKNEWRDIEFMMRAWCGNSYYDIKLGAHQYWQLVCPTYKGAFKTRLRLKLEYGSGKKENASVIYSNEFEGSINPGQLCLSQVAPSKYATSSYLFQ